jgi:hypothetical protein
MTTWTQINTGAATTTVYDFNTYGALAYADGCFADGAINEAWGLINTTQNPNWTQVSTGAISAGYEFDPYANLAFGEGCFADGAINEPWTLISTV